MGEEREVQAFASGVTATSIGIGRTQEVKAAQGRSLLFSPCFAGHHPGDLRSAEPPRLAGFHFPQLHRSDPVALNFQDPMAHRGKSFFKVMINALAQGGFDPGFVVAGVQNSHPHALVPLPSNYGPRA